MSSTSFASSPPLAPPPPPPPPSSRFAATTSIPLLISRDNQLRRCPSPLLASDQQSHRRRRHVGVVINLRISETRAKANLRGSDVEAIGVPASVPVRVAHEFLQAGHHYLDVRTPEEFSAGHATGAINIPYMYRVGSGMTKNPRFIEEVSMNFRMDAEIIIGCQIGKRSMMAAKDLLAAGFTAITDIAGGFSAWTQNGLPTER